jgi:hypothetical protein
MTYSRKEIVAENETSIKWNESIQNRRGALLDFRTIRTCRNSGTPLSKRKNYKVGKIV